MHALDTVVRPAVLQVRVKVLQQAVDGGKGGRPISLLKSHLSSMIHLSKWKGFREQRHLT